MSLYLAAVASVAMVALFLWQDGILQCSDGDRYTSGKPQPSPFNRRFCGWQRKVLIPLSIGCLVALGTLMGTPTKALLLLSLPGAWFIATHPTCVDAPCMLLAWLSSMFVHTNFQLSIALACASGFIHERGPVFAAVYSLSPIPLLGLFCVGWWRKAEVDDPDPVKLVSHGAWAAIKAHKPYQDFLDGKVLLVGLRGLLPLAVYDGMPARSWLSLAVAVGSRVLGTDTCRFLFWAAPPIVADARDVPMWYLALHLVTFRRSI